jgi:aldehyde dehydrogenase (NAD+)
MVVKPAENTPTSTVRLVELLNQVLPKGVLNVVSGPGSVVGEALTLHPDVDKVSFTGSTNMGRRVQQNAALTMKRVTLELGGKGPGIVLPDADLERVAYGALWGVYLNAGQACESGTRLLVHESIYEDLLQRLKTLSERVVLGNPMDPATGMGPMSSESHFHKVLQYIDSAKAEGARIVTGGKRADVEGCEGGFFVEPTVIADVTNAMKVAREEIFGPVLSVIKYSDLDDAVAMANDSDYGLSAGVWTEDLVQAQTIARELQAGSVWINDWHMMRGDAAFGGFKQSGYGREFGKYSLSSYVETKSVSTSFERNPAAKKLHRIVHTQMP